MHAHLLEEIEKLDIRFPAQLLLSRIAILAFRSMEVPDGESLRDTVKNTNVFRSRVSGLPPLAS